LLKEKIFCSGFPNSDTPKHDKCDFCASFATSSCQARISKLPLLFAPYSSAIQFMILKPFVRRQNMAVAGQPTSLQFMILKRLLSDRSKTPQLQGAREIEERRRTRAVRWSDAIECNEANVRFSTVGEVKHENIARCRSCKDS
jgi:hypothetical protein